MLMSADVPDGATQRHSRLMELLTFINLAEPHGVNITQIQSHMLTVYGLKFKTTSEMVKELMLSGVIKADGHGFYHLTEKQQAAMKRFLAQEEREKPLTPLLKHIDNIKDPAVRQKALKLYEELAEILQEPSDSQS
jgi:predicted transcriptional regulator